MYIGKLAHMIARVLDTWHYVSIKQFEIGEQFVTTLSKMPQEGNFVFLCACTI